MCDTKTLFRRYIPSSSYVTNWHWRQPVVRYYQGGRGIRTESQAISLQRRVAEKVRRFATGASVQVSLSQLQGAARCGGAIKFRVVAVAANVNTAE